MLKVVTIVLRDGFCLLSSAFKVASPNSKYQTDTARRLLLQMPLVSVCVGNPSSGKSFTLLIEGMDFAKVGLILNHLTTSFASSDLSSLEKSCVKLLLSLAQSDRELDLLSMQFLKLQACQQPGLDISLALSLFHTFLLKLKKLLLKLLELEKL